VIDWLKEKWWTLGIALYVIISDHIEPFKSSFLLSMVGAIAVGLIMGAVEVALRKMRPSRN
jgi:hypothetical protein